MVASGPSPRRFAFLRRLRLSGGAQFDAVFANAVRTGAGPLVIHSTPNGLNHLRIGLAVSTHVGTAVQRNLIKRRLREAFRFLAAEWSSRHHAPKVDSGAAIGRGYDLVVKVRPHQALELQAYQRVLAAALHELDLKWIKRAAIPPRNSTRDDARRKPRGRRR